MICEMTQRSPKNTPSTARIKTIRIETPPFQNWSCHGCTNCCRGALLIHVTAEEKRRIEAQGWTQADGVDPATMLAAHGDRFRLGHQSDGACVFLDSSGRCRIHARFGEDAKPLACRLYPLAIHPAGKKLAVSLRFDCPSAVKNQGKPLAEQLQEIRKLAEQIVPADYNEGTAPPVLRGSGPNWEDFLRYVSYLDKTMAESNVPIALKLLRALLWVRAVEKARVDKLSGGDADEALGILLQNARERLSAMPRNCPPPTRFGQLFFRTLVVEHARTITVNDMDAPARYRTGMLRTLLRFALATGNVPAASPELKEVPFDAVEKPFGPLPPDAEAMLTRFFRVKIEGLHFCGRAYYDVPLIEGFYSLALLFPVILWLSRWLAVGGNRSSLSDADVARAIAIADHNYGYSSNLGSHGARWRVRLMAQRDDISRLCCWCSR
jgi:lysine-N-methylase